MSNHPGITCPKCKSRYIIKKGKRVRKKRTLTQYKCNNCGAYFTNAKLKKRTYRPTVILASISSYNKGNTLSETSKQINSRFGVKTYPKLISTWLNDYNKICSYHRIRKETGKTPNPIIKKEFKHKQVYLFKYHKIKIERFVNKYFSPLKDFLETINDQCPNELFHSGSRGSQITLTKKGVKIYKTKNRASDLAKFALAGVKDNKKRHEKIQDLMLTNDTATIAVEVPVWMEPNEFTNMNIFSNLHNNITGHIDAVQIRYGLIYMLDYKPEAFKEKPISQLFFYAFALSKRTDIWLRNFRCAWFDENNYYEFNPNLIILDNENIQKHERKKYWIPEDQWKLRKKELKPYLFNASADGR